MSLTIRSLNKRRIILLVVLILCIVAAIRVFFYLKKPTRLNDMAYDVNKRHGYTVYIEEESGYAPYLVLTNDYEGDGNVLLVRKYILSERQPFNKGWDSTAYYEESYIDEFLNTTFLSRLDDDIKNKLVISDIKIQDYSVWTGGGPRGEPEVKEIQRQVFLLSYLELSPGETSARPQDGIPLKYFKSDVNRIIATDMDGNPSAWSLRSAITDSKTANIVVTFEGKVTANSIFDMIGIRPAFCLSRETGIIEDNTIEQGQNVYVLKEPK